MCTIDMSPRWVWPDWWVWSQRWEPTADDGLSPSQMCPIGQTQCSVMDIVKAPGQCCKLDIQFDNATCGYLHIRAWKVSDRGGEEKGGEEKGGEEKGGDGRSVHSCLLNRLV